MVVDCNWNHITLRMYQASYEINHIKTTALLDGIFVLFINILALLRMVGVLELHKR